MPRSEARIAELADWMGVVLDERPRVLNEATTADERTQILLAEALVEWSRHVHPPGDRAEFGMSIGEDELGQLYRATGSLRKAAEIVGVSHTTLWRMQKNRRV